jgi:hypothetical protein
MNIKEELTCQVCNKIFKDPITLSCGKNICKHHIKELISKSASNKFTCPFCYKENPNQDFKVNKLIENLIKRELHGIKFNPKYEETLNNLKTEFQSLEAILRDPEVYIFDEINELIRLVDLDREKLKSHINELANYLIKKLISFREIFKANYRANVDFVYLITLFQINNKKINIFKKNKLSSLFIFTHNHSKMHPPSQTAKN